MRADRGWLAWLVAGALAIVGYFLLPAESAARSVLYDLLGLVSAALMIVAVRRVRPARAEVWYWMASGQVIWVCGDVTYSLYQHVLHQSPYPSVADVFYLAAYPLIAIGLGLLVRGRRTAGDRAGLLDASIVATGLGLLCWTFLLRPILADQSVRLLTRSIAVAYPAADILILGMLAWLITTSGARTVSYQLLVSAVAMLLASDVAFSAITTYSNFTGGVTDAGWLLSYVLWAAAALHPSVRQLSDPAPGQPGLTRRRRITLLVAMLIPPADLFIEGLTRHGRVDWVGASTGTLILWGLIATRVANLVGLIQRQGSRLANFALYDDLTGLGNRVLLEQRLARVIAEPTAQVQVAVVDLDDFRSINDKLGRRIGDQLLIGVADRLRSATAPANLLTRTGGDDFAMLIVDSSPGEADALVNRLLRDLQEPVPAGSQQFLVKASIGVADSAGAEDVLEVLRRADVAVYAAKQIGSDGWVRYHPELDNQASEHARLGAELRAALDTGQFELVYQPIVTLPEGSLAGVEALVRWKHPTRGAVSPVEFIPVAERNGLIVELGRRILREACAQAVRWDEELGPGAPRKISVNVSARQLAEPNFADTVAEVLRSTGLPAGRLTIEVTETAVFGGGRSVSALQAVQRLGVAIALDDFGTGHSSLGLLHTCPVDILKVDKSFVDQITLAGRHSVIAAAVITICEGLRLTAVAEGVETAAQADKLFTLGYRLAQGYHFSRPVPAEELHRALPADPRHDVSTAV